MNRSLRKAARDLIVTLVGTALLYVADNISGLGLPAEYAAFIAPTALLLYRLLRERFDTLAEVDRVG